MVSSMSLSEVVSSQGRFIAATEEQPQTPIRIRHVPRGPPPSLLAGILPARLLERRGLLLQALSHAAAQPGRKSWRRPRPPRGWGPSAASRARPGHSPGPASLGRRGFLLASFERRARTGQWALRGVGRGVGTLPRTWEPRNPTPAVTFCGGRGRRRLARTGRAGRAWAPGIWSFLFTPRSLPPNFYPGFKE